MLAYAAYKYLFKNASLEANFKRKNVFFSWLFRQKIEIFKQIAKITFLYF